MGFMFYCIKYRFPYSEERFTDSHFSFKGHLIAQDNVLKHKCTYILHKRVQINYCFLH